MTDKINGNSLTWTGLIIRILLCYVVFAVASEMFFPFEAGFTGTTAEILAWTAISYLVQFLAIYVLAALIAVSIAKFPVKNRLKPIQKFLNGALVATMLIGGLLIYGGWYSENKLPGNTSTRSSATTNIEKSSSPKEPVQAFETIQSAQGATEEDLDLAFLNELENWIVETMYQKGRDNYAAMGFTSENFKSKIVANSTYVVADGKKLAFIKINFDNSVRLVTIIGIKGSQLHRVSCARSSNHDIPVWSGECGNKVNEVFNVSIRL